MSEVEARGQDFIEHYGVKGMKWGVRRSSAQLAKSAKKEQKQGNAQAKSARKSAVKQRRTLNEKDIDALVDRLQKEKKLKDLVTADVSGGKSVAKNLLGDVGKQVAKQVIAGVAVAAVSVAVANKMGTVPEKGSPAKNTPQTIAKLIRTGGKEKGK